MTHTEDTCTVSYTPRFIASPTEAFERLIEDLPLSQHDITIFGRKTRQPRLVSWHGPGDYAYSGLELQAAPWSTDLLSIRDQIEQETKIKFNSVLANYYRDEHDSVGWHADDEHYFGNDPTIVTISLGAPRLFCMKRKTGKGKPDKFVLENGSMFLMGKGVQQHWLHSVPKSLIPVGPRLSLTYRVWSEP